MNEDVEDLGQSFMKEMCKHIFIKNNLYILLYGLSNYIGSKIIYVYVRKLCNKFNLIGIRQNCLFIFKLIGNISSFD